MNIFVNRKINQRNAVRRIAKPLAARRKPAAQIAHLVFFDTKSNAKKPKELFISTVKKLVVLNNFITFAK